MKAPAATKPPPLPEDLDPSAIDPTPPPLAASGVQSIDVRRIKTLTNHRLGADDLGELVESIRTHGLRQPVEVWEIPARLRPGACRYTLAFGHRRLAAVKKLGEPTIEAFVVPAADYDIGAIRTVQAVENMMRRELTPIEEALACAALVTEGLGDAADLDDAGIERAARTVAAKLGRSLEYVRDRMRLARLSPAVRDMVAAGELLMGHALVLARCGDPGEQLRLAKVCSLNYREYGMRGERLAGRPGMSLPELRRAVGNHFESLKGVPWQLDVAFNGKPACTTCPHNGGNQRSLFVDKDDMDPEARCLKAVCYNAKQKAAAHQQDRLIALVVRMTKKGETSPDMTPAREGPTKAPSWLKLATVQRRAKAEVVAKAGGNGKGKPKAKAKSGFSVYVEGPEQKHRTALSRWKDKASEQLAAKLIAEPLRLMMAITFLEAHPQFDRWTDDKKARKLIAGELAGLLKLIDKPTIAHATELSVAIAKRCSAKGLLQHGIPGPLIERLAKGAGLVLDPPPTLKQFQDVARQEAKAQAAAKKKTSKRSKTTKPSKRKARR